MISARCSESFYQDGLLVDELLTSNRGVVYCFLGKLKSLKEFYINKEDNVEEEIIFFLNLFY
ncbi:hypothetical protein SAMN04489761_3883 [Tenacibaculum sp. MAR_2009_124]|uniref:hypothetical protein n=1 Tax=Tenacibaculum sp. MAR_2009_124 TaxID=1250059 RepID=UPI000894BB97|nr:hypothetical protein [Tenacibaculum sp. MAR_2009_124]SEC89106.1 hypothetical protein SAMN04489761_3883 [Tenacibaculum sp. MAR_2009_124]